MSGLAEHLGYSTGNATAAEATPKPAECQKVPISEESEEAGLTFCCGREEKLIFEIAALRNVVQRGMIAGCSDVFDAWNYHFPDDKREAYKQAAPKPAEPVAQEPVAFGVREEDGSGGVWSWIAEWPEAAHEHINDAIDRYLGEVGDHPPKYTVVPLYRAPHDLAALLKDAERYRWLRADSRPAAWRLEYWVGYWECSTFGDDLDAAIDKELAKCTTS